MHMTLIEPRTLKGFRDYLPEAMIPRERLIATAQRVYRSFGYSPIDTRSVAADIETALVIHDLMRGIATAFGRELPFTIRVNNRAVLSGLLAKLGLSDKSTAILRALDKLGKIGREKVAEEMIAAAGASPEQADQVLKLTDLAGTNDELLAQLAPLIADNPQGEEGVERLRQILRGAKAGGVSDN